MTARQARFEGTGAVREAHRFDVDRLHEFLVTALDGYAGPLTVSQFKGGQSNPTYQLDTPDRSYVLRRKPPGKLLPSAHAVDREYRVLSALYAAGFPVPRPYLLCSDEAVVGTTFYVMEFLDGRIAWDPDLPDCEPGERSEIYDDLNRTIAALHSIDYAALGLGDFGKPGNYFARQIARWAGQYRASETTTVPAMDRLIDWLPDNVPADDTSAIVHGDFRLDNIVLHPVEPRVIGVLDWELSTIGHPLGDFTYHLMAWQMPDTGIGSAGLAGKPLAELGLPDEETYVARYCERTGRERIEHRDFYAAYNFFRIAAIVQGIAGRVRDGTAASDHADKAAAAVAPLAERGWQYAERLQAGQGGSE